MFEKLHKYVGKSVEQLVNRPDAPHVFRLHKKVRSLAERVLQRRHCAWLELFRAAAMRCGGSVGGPDALPRAQHVYYVREDIMKRAISVRAPARLLRALRFSAPLPTPTQVARENLIALGVCIGKFTHSDKFILTIGALDVLSQYAKFKARAQQSAWLFQSAPEDATATFSLQTERSRAVEHI